MKLLGANEAELCANHQISPENCPQELSIKGLNELIRSFPKEKPTQAAEIAIVYVGVVLVLYIALLAMFVSGTFRKFIAGSSQPTGRRHMMAVPEEGPVRPELAEHYPIPSAAVTKV